MSNLAIPLGAVVHDVYGVAWVYVGSGKRKPFYTSSVNHCFVRAQKEKLQEPIWTYMAVEWETILKKFPDITDVVAQ